MIQYLRGCLPCRAAPPYAQPTKLKKRAKNDIESGAKDSGSRANFVSQIPLFYNDAAVNPARITC